MASAVDPQSLTIKQLAQKSALSLSTLRRRVKDGSLPTIQPGGGGKKMLFLPTVLDALSAARVVDADAMTGNKLRGPETETTEKISDHGPAYGSQSDQFVGEAMPSEPRRAVIVAQRATSGRRLSWMRSPLFQNQTKQDPK
jgi:hypothetical protein